MRWQVVSNNTPLVGPLHAFTVFRCLAGIILPFSLSENLWLDILRPSYRQSAGDRQISNGHIFPVWWVSCGILFLNTLFTISYRGRGISISMSTTRRKAPRLSGYLLNPNYT